MKLNDKIKFAIANDLVNSLVKRLERNGNVDTGELKNSIHVLIKEDRIIIEMAEQGEWIEFGTNPHVIRPNSKKALFWKGAKHPVKMINHPGTRPSPFIRPAIHQDLKNIINVNIAKFS